MANTTIYKLDITGTGNRCDGWNTYTLTRVSGNRIPTRSAIVAAGYDFLTYTNVQNSSGEFGIYGFAVNGGPYTGASYGSSAPTTIHNRVSMNVDGQSSDDDYTWDFQGGDVWVRGRNNSMTRMDCYNCRFEYQNMVSESALSGDSIYVKVKFGNTLGAATYVQNYGGDSAIYVWIQWESFWIDTGSVGVSVTQNGFVMNIARTGSASISHGSITGYEFRFGSTVVATTSGWSVNKELSMSQLGTEYGYYIIPLYTYGTTSGGAAAAAIFFTAALPSLSWSGGAHIEFSQVGVQAKIDLDGSGVFDHGFSGTCYYRVFCAGVRKNSDGDTRKSWTFDPTAYGTTLTYAVDAYATIQGYTFYAGQLTVQGIVNNHSTVKYYHPTRGWIECIVYYYDGTQWIECIPYYYDGTRWREISHS